MNALVLVLVVVGRDDPGATDAAVRAARAALPSGATVVVQRADAMPDDAALRVERAEDARAVAIVSWTDPVGLRIRLRVHRRDDGRFIDRDLVFDGTDAPSERGRTVGFAIASMVPEATGAPSPPTPPPAQPAASVAPAESRPGVETVEAPRGASSPPHAAVDAAALAALGVDGYGGGAGGRLGAAWLPSPRIAIRVDGSFRSGEVAPAKATSIVVTVGPGISWDAIASTPEQPLGAGIRWNALAIMHQHSHLSDEPEPIRKNRWLLGTSATLEGSLRLSEGAHALLSGGAEFAFGQTDVFLAGKSVATIPPVRLVADIGIRVRF
jgi:hypothetical protein